MYVKKIKDRNIAFKIHNEQTIRIDLIWIKIHCSDQVPMSNFSLFRGVDSNSVSLNWSRQIDQIICHNKTADKLLTRREHRWKREDRKQLLKWQTRGLFRLCVINQAVVFTV